MSTAEWLIVGLSFYVYLVARGLSKQIEGVERRLERRLVSPEERAELDAQQIVEAEWRRDARKAWWHFVRNAFLFIVAVIALVWILSAR
jgi:vacuolar-type H+-ATPase subunit I/STV1